MKTKISSLLTDFLLHEKFKEVCFKYPERVIVKSKTISSDASLTLRDIYILTLSIFNWLSKEGIAKGERVAIILENCPEWISIYFGILFSGGICVPLDPHINPNEIENFLKDCEAKFIFISKNQVVSFEQVIKKFNFIKRIVVLGTEEDSKIFFSFEKIRKIEPKEIEFVQSQLDDIASILYTSGTTAIPKGVILTHKNFSANFNSIKKINLCSEKDIFLSMLPFYHAYAFMATLIFPIFLGAKIIFPLSLKAKDLTACMNKEEVTILVGVPELFYNLHKAIFQEINNLPFLIRLILKRILFLNYWFRKMLRINLGKLFFRKVHSRVGANLRYMVSGGARLEPKIAIDLFKLGFNILEGYGLTETAPIVSLSPVHKPKFGTVGRALSGVEIKIVNPNKDGVGEVIVKGENVFKGYYKKEVETRNAIKDEWFYTGDLGFLDKGNYLYLTGRSKEVIVLSSGKNIYPEEIEEYYKKTNVIKELCVLEVNDDKGNISLQAVVVPNFDYFKMAEGGNIYRKIKWEFENISYNLPTYKRITGFILTKDDLPRTALGKIKRYEVKERYLREFVEKEKPFETKEPSPEDLKLLNSAFANKVMDFFKAALSLKERPNLDDHLELDLGVDSLAKVELIAGLEKLFNVSISESVAMEITNVRQAILKLIELFSGRINQGQELSQIEPSWVELLAIAPSDEIKNKIELKPSILNKFLTLILIKFLFRIFKIFWRLEVKGKDNIPKKGYFIFCANHASYLDGLAVAAAMPFPVLLNLYFIGWRQIFEHPAIKWANKMARLVPIDSSMELISTMRAASFILKNSKSICIFPEGQRTIDGKIKEFRKGMGILVKELGPTVIPLAIKGTFEAWPRTRGFPKTYPIKVVFGKPITKQDLLAKIAETQIDYEAISSYLREEVEKLFLSDD
ncbi:MAG: AMP-binding protein [Candidatus Omnitrophota bacterium]|nr:AMP-binding protein [Candidatus Omnitrophota bacterium]